MKVKYDNKKQVLSFGKNAKYGKIQFQNGSLNNHKENGVVDTDIILGLMQYLHSMNKQHNSNYNVLAMGNLQSAYTFLDYRRISQYYKNKADQQKQVQKNTRRRIKKHSV